MFELLSRKERMEAAGLFALFLLMSVAEVAGIASILPFMSVLSNPDSVYDNKWLKMAYEFFEFSSPTKFLFAIGIGVLAVLVLSNAIKAITRWMTIYITQTWGEGLSRRLFEIYLGQPYRFFLDRNSSDISKNVLAEVHVVTNNVLMSFLDMATKIIVSTVILGFLAIMDPVLAVATTALLGGMYIAVFLAFKKSLRVEAHRRNQAQSEKYKIVKEAIQGVKNIKLGGYESLYNSYFSISAEHYSASTAKSTVIAEMPKYAMEVIAFGGILLMILYLLLQSPQGLTHALPLIALYVFAGYRLMPGMQGIYYGFSRMRFHKPVLDIIRRELDLSKSVQSFPENDVASLPFHDRLALKQVCFQYDPKGRDILKDVSIDIAAHKTIGIVGKTGAGKTTFVDIVLGLLEPTSGYLEIDGTRIDDSNRKAWQKNLSYVSQHIYLCDDTIIANIAFGARQENVDMDKVRAAARAASLSDFIEGELPKGYETIVGENGIRLSGGQRQRIGLARALYMDRPVLVLDEATSALDPSTEEEIMKSIYGLSDRKTVFIISHKFELLSKCDSILMVQNGGIAKRESDTVGGNPQTLRDELLNYVSSANA